MASTHPCVKSILGKKTKYTPNDWGGRQPLTSKSNVLERNTASKVLEETLNLSSTHTVVASVPTAAEAASAVCWQKQGAVWKGPAWAMEALLHGPRPSNPRIKKKTTAKHPNDTWVEKKFYWDGVSRAFSKGCKRARDSHQQNCTPRAGAAEHQGFPAPSAEAAGQRCYLTVFTPNPLLAMPGPRQHTLSRSSSSQRWLWGSPSSKEES